MYRRFAVVLAALLPAAAAYAANWPEHPVLHAVRATQSPVVDGDLSDPAWQKAPEFTDFTQHDPDDGKPATMLTSVRIVYDDHAIYFGVKMFDPQKPTGLLARRDNFVQSDFLSINLDPRHDRLSGNAFTVQPAGVQVDTSQARSTLVVRRGVGHVPSRRTAVRRRSCRGSARSAG